MTVVARIFLPLDVKFPSDPEPFRLIGWAHLNNTECAGQSQQLISVVIAAALPHAKGDFLLVTEA